MNIAIPLAATVAALALTWFFCIRPMLRRNAGTGAAGCCVAPSGKSVDEQIREARQDLHDLQAATPATAEEGLSPRASGRES